ncbi:conserved hypothetical protein [Leishmania infantum JPCM5]|uniref:Endonuclease/Exonuclease/phosphatase_family_-_putative n=2 Tax=Leishmania infantum TaxID=5671 RepID=A0A6L0XPV0_LEIIN|nr:conserved hypothetical protein [Leishmania infantum JPCM5]CAC9543125.1 Endonuclease/Exonuclease/phosphatase_family_-_putative [Leishmania infantum]CAM71979.1 conserved hypothetical protein [Leishmania infantum JPCM5]SUZ45898.1 Endonuclease/Exonuclease/phosphatase_family_-_putative [Leishmania infantum]|eukprot:XP_001468887.1 conserved hypothetical protein [Leishmania infantum JPCM5]
MPIFDNKNHEKVLKVMKAGDLLHYDYRPADKHCGSRAKLSDTFRVVQWNIERGVKLDAIIADLKALHADFIVLQELDINCRRSNYANVPKEIAKALEAELYFACEFQELDSSLRAPVNAVGPRSQPALEPETPPNSGRSGSSTRKPAKNHHFHGNAILSRHATLREPTVIPLTSPFVWDEAGDWYKEPRLGFRSALRVRIDSVDRTSVHMAPLYIYCCHFEVFCGGLARVRQLADCMADMQRIAHVSTALNGARSRHPAFLLAGDLNTIAHGIVRLSRRYATDRLRWLSFGEVEACWLQRKVLGRNMQFLQAGCCPLSYHFLAGAASRVHQFLCNNSLVWQYVYGFTRSEQDRMSNVHLCLYDPSDKFASITLDNPAYYGFARGKLDWILLSNLQPRPFRTARNGAEPIDIALLERNGSILTTSYSARYLHSIYDGSHDKAREASVQSNEASAECVPQDGYLLFNENYTASDHRGLVMTVRQNSGRPQDVYPSKGAPYTATWTVVGFLILTRAVPVVAVALGLYHTHKMLH